MFYKNVKTMQSDCNFLQIGTSLWFPPIFAMGDNFVTSHLLPYIDALPKGSLLLKESIYSLREKSCSFKTDSYSEKNKKESSRIASPEKVPMHLKYSQIQATRL